MRTGIENRFSALKQRSFHMNLVYYSDLFQSPKLQNNNYSFNGLKEGGITLGGTVLGRWKQCSAIRQITSSLVAYGLN